MSDYLKYKVWGARGGGIEQKEKKKEKKLLDKDSSVVIGWEEGAVGGRRRWRAGQSVWRVGDLTRGGEGTRRCTDATLQNCAPERVQFC